MLESTVIIGKGESGVGQVAGLFARELEEFYDRSFPVAGRGEIGEVMKTHPNLVIVATPNPVRDVMSELKPHLDGMVTVMLPQNGVAADRDAQEILQSLPGVTLIPASLYTAVSMENGKPKYDDEKRRICLANMMVADETDVIRRDQLVSEFREMEFEVHRSSNPAAMRHQKLVFNLLGNASSLCGYRIPDGFSDPELWRVEFLGHRQRMAAMRRRSWRFEKLPWIKWRDHIILTQIATKVPPDWVPLSTRRKLGESILKDRGVEPAQYRAMRDGRLPREWEYYLAFADIGCQVDLAIRKTIKVNPDLWLHMPPEARRGFIVAAALSKSNTR